MVPYPFLSLSLPFVSLLFPLACSSSRGILLQHVSPIALELVLMLINISYTQWVVKIQSRFLVCYTMSLSALSEHFAWEQNPSFHPICSVTLNSPYSGGPHSCLVTCWVVWPRSALREAEYRVWACHASGAVGRPVPGTCSAAVAAFMGQGSGKRNPRGDVHQWNPHLGPGQDKIFQWSECWQESVVGIILARTR